MDNQPLAGRVVAIPETREVDVFAAMLERRGARVVRCPMVAIRDAPDPAPILHWSRELASGSFDDLILLTGEGLHRILACIDRHEPPLRERFVAALAGIRKITRGPKPARALRGLGLKPDIAAERPTTDGVIASLQPHNLKDRRFGVQLYGTEPNRPLVEFLGQVDAIAFTSTPQVERLFAVAPAQTITAALGKTLVAAVGPVVAETLQKHGVQARLMPEESFFLKPLTSVLEEALAHGSPGLGAKG
jgi:uroporphyrinogen-III synthase